MKELVVFIMVAVRCLTIKPYVAALRVLTVRNVKVNIRNIFHLKINYKQHELKLSIFFKDSNIELLVSDFKIYLT